MKNCRGLGQVRIIFALIVVFVSVAATALLAAGLPAAFQLSLPQTGGTIDLSAPRPLAVGADEVKDWVQRAATALTHFYGRYPVRRVSIIVLPANRGGVRDGVEYDGRRIQIRLGHDVTHQDLLGDWMITHEMFHLSQPDVEGGYSWMSEGMADYLEPVARVRIGQITPQRFWRDLVEGLPNGLPTSGDRGLDYNDSWGRTYWGGALYWLMADIRIRQQTKNHKSVRDAARAVLDAGGDGSQTWPMDQLLKTYDQGVGGTVFEDLHRELGLSPGNTDLDALWKSLGVVNAGPAISFDDEAPLAAVRRGITAAEK